MNGTDTAKQLCYQAMSTRYGIAIASDNVPSAKAFLSLARKSDPELASLTFKSNPKDPSEIWILRTVNNDGKVVEPTAQLALAEVSFETLMKDEI